MIRLSIGSIATTAIGLTLVSLSALAQSPPTISAVKEVRSDDGGRVRAAVVRYGDLNLSSTAGITVLHRRLTAAADSVCLPLAASRELARHVEWRACRDNAIATAVEEIDHPLLTQYYRALTDEG